MTDEPTAVTLAREWLNKPVVKCPTAAQFADQGADALFTLARAVIEQHERISAIAERLKEAVDGSDEPTPIQTLETLFGELVRDYDSTRVQCADARAVRDDFRAALKEALEIARGHLDIRIEGVEYVLSTASDAEIYQRASSSWDLLRKDEGRIAELRKIAEGE